MDYNEDSTFFNNRNTKYMPKKGAIMFWGLTRGLKHTITNLRTHLFDVLKENDIEYDIFIHTWYFEGEYSNKRHGVNPVKLDFAEYKLLNAKYVILEDQDKVKKEFDLQEYQSRGDFFGNGFQSSNFYILSLISQKRIVSKFEEVKDEYDFVIFQRPDILYEKKFNIDYLDLVKSDNIVAPLFGSTVKHNTVTRTNDRWCLCSPDNAIKYGTVLDHLLGYSKTKSVCAEVYLSSIIQGRYKLKIYLVDITFSRVKPDGTVLVHERRLIDSVRR